MPKRTYRRFSLGMGDDAHGSRLEDLSEGGMKILSNKVFKIDQQFPTKIRSPEGPISVKARIVRARLSRREGYKYEYGASLKMASDEDYLRMKGFVQHLSQTADELPEEPGKEDLEELKAQISRLQESLEELQDREAVAIEEQKKKGSGPVGSVDEFDDAAFETSFGVERFTHLTNIGQPMKVTVDDPAVGLVGKRYHLVAEALTDPFDLESLSRSLRGLVAKEVIPETLFELYERKRIDFA